MSDSALSDFDYDACTESVGNASGIVHCLRMLADEAGALQLPETAQALRVALTVCNAETSSTYSRSN